MSFLDFGSRLLTMIFLTLMLGQNLPAQQAAAKETNQYPGSIDYKIYLPSLMVPNLSIFGASLKPYSVNGGIELFQSAASRWTRIGLNWSDIEPTKGLINWSYAASFEQDLLNINNAGMKPVVILGETPAWAVKPGFACGVIDEQYSSEFARFAGEAVKRFSTSPYNVMDFEIYNEPDAPGFLGCWGDLSDHLFNGGEKYGRMLQSIYPAMKAANPNIKVLVGGLLLDCDPVNPPDLPNKPGVKQDCTMAKFFEGILKSGAGAAFDGVAFHAYDYYLGSGNYFNPNWHSSRTTTGPSTLAKAAYLRSMMQKYGVANKPLYNTEFSLFIENNGDEATKAYYIVEFMAAALADHYNAAIYYEVLGGRGNSLLNPDLTPLPAYNAFSFANQVIGNAAYSRMIPDPQFIIHELTNGNKKIWIVWTKDNMAHTLTLPLPSSINRIGVDGNPISDPISTSVTLDIAPAIIQFGP